MMNMTGPSGTCAFSYDVVDELSEKNITAIIAKQWPCELREFWAYLKPFSLFVRALLHYGTSGIVAVGVLLNGLSFYILTRKNMRKSIPNAYLAVLAVYDTLVLVMNFMIGVLRGTKLSVNKTFQDSQNLCKFHGVIVELFNLLSVWVILAFTVERFISVRFPFVAKRVTLARARTTIAVLSTIILIFSLHKVFISGFEGDSVFGYKACKTNRKTIQEAIYFYVAFNTWLPTIVITTLNSIIIFEIHKNKTKRQQMLHSENSSTKSEDRATRLLLTVSFTYIFMVLPLGIIQTTELIWNGSRGVPAGHPDYVTFMKTKLTLKWTRAFFFFFYQFNFAINFLLYVFSAPGARFKATLKRALGLHLRMEDESALATLNPRTNAVGPASNTNAQRSDVNARDEKPSSIVSDSRKDHEASGHIRASSSTK